MKLLTTRLLLAVGAVTGAAALCLGGLNWWLGQAETRRSIEGALSEAMGAPVQLQRIAFTPWGGVQLGGVAVPPATEGAAPFLEASGLEARHRVLPLLRRKLVFHELALNGPQIVWTQQRGGGWPLPALPGMGDKGKPGKPKGETDPEKQARTAREADDFQVEVERFEIRDGSVEMRDDEGRRTALATGVHITYRMPGAGAVEGTLTVQRLSWQEALHFDEVATSFAYRDGELALPDLRGGLAGGKVDGSLNLKLPLGKKEKPFALKLGVEKADFGRLTTDAGWQPGQATGTLAGSLDLQGDWRKGKKATGTGRLTLQDGSLKSLGLLQNIGQVLGIAELTSMRIREGRADFHVADERTHLDRLSLDGGDVRLHTKGTVKFDGKVALEAELMLAETVAKRLPGFIREGLGVPTDGSPGRAIPFTITGKPDKLRTNLMDKYMGPKLGAQVEDLVGRALGLRKDKKEKEGDGRRREPGVTNIEPAEPPKEP